MKRFFIALSLGLALAGCAPKVVMQATGPARTANPAEGFLVIKETDAFTGPAEELGTIYIKDSGFTLSCDYETVVALATQQARQLGANVLRIYEHLQPNMMSTCHRIRAKALRVADLTPYETEIVWNPARRLRQVDFKASTANRPFEAATSSSLRYHYAGHPLQGKVSLTIETVFDCQRSYFKGTRNPAYTLAHEQGHFDISEIYARRFTKLIQEQVPTVRELQARQEDLYHQLMLEAQATQDKYDTEVYADPSKQPAWLSQITQQLNELQPYASKQVTLKI
ncbi:hypothetical protein GKZ68_16220 [Hymenobacter sp. BRD128]|uniref:hypothetical protein n=1 Tax=Hymenobacter sp. BRD128 TaxID=2675878 RepID=UPI0015652BDF|nr:hypothetical protein [Hymenobacter sp. BRD128]QKG58029.1 hypothetical protein GKZ68_16220 [Hymenobacter sp. BRD128]